MRALVLSGGGTHGAYQVGVLKHLLGDLKTHYDIVTGVSVGAINAAALAQYKKGEEQEAALLMEDLWLSIDNGSIWRHRWLPYIAALWNSSVYSTEPLRELLEENLDRQRLLTSGKLLRVAAVSLNTGLWQVWTEQDPDILEGVMASSAFPGMFEAIRSRNQYFTDGGVRTVTPLKDAIDAGADTIDIILTFRPGTKRVNGELKTLKVLLRSLNIMMDEVVTNDLKICELKNNIEGYRKIQLNIYSPSVALEGASLDFSPSNIRYEIDLGYKDATNKE